MKRSAAAPEDKNGKAFFRTGVDARLTVIERLHAIGSGGGG